MHLEIDALSIPREEIPDLLIRAKFWKSNVSTVPLILHGHPCIIDICSLIKLNRIK